MESHGTMNSLPWRRIVTNVINAIETFKALQKANARKNKVNVVLKLVTPVGLPVAHYWAVELWDEKSNSFKPTNEWGYGRHKEVVNQHAINIATGISNTAIDDLISSGMIDKNWNA